MIGKLIAKIRKDKKLSKAFLARESNLDTGYITHLEFGDRNPSHKALQKLCDCMEIPYQPIMYTYDKELTAEHVGYDILSKICYDKILAVNNIDTLIPCPQNMKSASLAIRITDDSMEPKLPIGSYAFVEFNTPLDNRDIGLFEYQNKYIFRKLIVRQDGITLRALKEGIADIKVKNDEHIYFLGKVLGTNDIWYFFSYFYIFFIKTLDYIFF